MNTTPLTASIEQFAMRMAGTPDARLEETWIWNSYDEDGVRFAFFRTYEDLRDLAGRLLQQRSASGSPPTEAQHLLAQYHATYRDMQGALSGLTLTQLQTAPNENDWPLARVLAHIMKADLGFFAVVSFALEGIRAPGRAAGSVYQAQDPTDDDWARIIGLEEPALDALVNGPLEPIIARLDEAHARVIRDYASISAAELDQPSIYWENEPYSLRFRLHRFDSHLRQHTIQIDKTRAALGLLPTESQRLLRLIYAALAEVEGALIGFEQPLPASIAETALSIDARLAEIAI